MRTFRERGIYSLPGGERFVLTRHPKGVYFLYSWKTWLCRGAVDYRIQQPTGQLYSGGLPTRWHERDLSDTGRTAPAPSTALLYDSL